MKKIIILLLSVLLLFPTVAFADTINVNSSTTESTTEANISMTKASYFKVTIPKSISLDGSSNSTSMDYTVNVEGDLSGHETIFVEPESEFTLTDKAGIKTKTANVTQEKESFTVPSVGTLTDSTTGTVSTTGIEAGSYKGSFHFNIHKDTTSGHTWQDEIDENGYIVRYCSTCGAKITDRLATYTITYSLDGGNATNPASYTVETDSFTLNNLTKVGYTFTGWSGTGLSGSANRTVTIAKGSIGNREYTAHFSPNTDTKYTVYHKQENLDGTYTLIDTDNLTGTTATSVTPATKTYTGFTSPSAQTVTIKPDGSTTVTYEYTRKSYTVTVNKGTGIATTTGSGSYKYGASVTVGYTLSSGYDFNNYTGDKTTATFTMPASNVTMQANGKTHSYSIAYNLNSGSISGQKTSYTVEDNAFTLPTPTKTGYTFTGWSGTELTGSTNKTVTVAKGSTGDRTYTANWQINKYTVDVNTVINGTTYSNGNSGFTFDVYLDGTLYKQNVIDFAESINYGTVVKVVPHAVTNYSNIQTYIEKTVGTANVTINPSWISSVSVGMSFYYAKGSTTPTTADKADILFVLIKDAKTWTNARAYAQSLGGELVMIKTAEINNFITNNVLANASVAIWIGANDAAVEGTWVWNDGTPLSSGFTNWNSGEPNNSGNEDYAEAYIGGSTNGKWNDLNGTQSYPFLVQINLK